MSIQPALGTAPVAARWVLIAAVAVVAACGGERDESARAADGGSAAAGDDFAATCERFAERMSATTCAPVEPDVCERAERHECRSRFQETFQCFLDRPSLRCDDDGRHFYEGCEEEARALRRCLDGPVPVPTCPDPSGCP
jgi:hypothetical protein